MLYADDAVIASRSRVSLAKMMAIVEGCPTFGLVSAEKKTDTIYVEAAGQIYRRVESFLYLGGTISGIGDVTPEIHSRIGEACPCFYSRAVYDNPYIALTTTVGVLKTEVIEVVLCRCVTWTIAHETLARYGRPIESTR
ncbi:unnamed protein product [Sphacelaria rigidula]